LLDSKDILKKMNARSPTLCLAKWLHLSLHLDRGSGHSCYHTPEEKIPLNGLQKNPSLLHNTNFKKEDRQKMINGHKPSGCSYCWRQESAFSPVNFSDRLQKSQATWAASQIDHILDFPNADLNPTYLEVSFSNICQLKCSYCGPHNSSSWQKEINEIGNYTNRTFPSVDNDSDSANYVNAFWSWWPSLIEKLLVLRITGGEPLLSKDTWKVLEDLIISPRPELELIINSNLSLEKHLFKKFLEKCKALLENRRVKSIKIITSLEAVGQAAEYIRYGVNLNFFWDNLIEIGHSHCDISISITNTIQVLSADSFLDFLKYFLAFRNLNKLSNLTFDPAPIVHPDFMRIENMPREEKSFFEQGILKFITENTDKLSDKEKGKLENLISILNIQISEEIIHLSRNKLVNYYKSYDSVRKTSFKNVFPNLRSY
jgi:organic radical activating enzyme